MKKTTIWKFILIGLMPILFINFFRIIIQLGPNQFKGVSFSNLVYGLIIIFGMILYGLILAFITSIPSLVVVGLCSFVIYFLNRNKMGKGIVYILTIVSFAIMGLFLSYSLFGITDKMDAFIYPNFMLKSINSAHPDDFISGAFLLSNYGVVVGFVVGLFVSIIYYFRKKLIGKKYEK